jgi:hypothetical protein
MPAKSLAVLSAALEAARLACIAAQNNMDAPAIKHTNKAWNKIDKAFKTAAFAAKLLDEEEYRFQLALLDAKMAKDAETEVVYESCVSPSGREYKVRADSDSDSK